MNNIYNKLTKGPQFSCNKQIWGIGVCVILPVVLLGCADTTTPILDKRFGSALTDAKQAQSLAPSLALSPEAAAAGLGKPSANESLRGLDVHNKGRAAPTALTAK